MHSPQSSTNSSEHYTTPLTYNFSRVCAYVRPWTSTYFEEFITTTFPDAELQLCTDYKTSSYHSFLPEFYRHFAASSLSKPLWLSIEDVHDVVYRDRLLRNYRITKPETYL